MQLTAVDYVCRGSTPTAASFLAHIAVQSRVSRTHLSAGGSCGLGMCRAAAPCTSLQFVSLRSSAAVLVFVMEN